MDFDPSSNKAGASAGALAGALAVAGGCVAVAGAGVMISVFEPPNITAGAEPGPGGVMIMSLELPIRKPLPWAAPPWLLVGGGEIAADLLEKMNTGCDVGATLGDP